MSEEERVIVQRRRVTQRWQESARLNGKNGGRPPGTPMSEEHKAKLKEAQAARRERERAERVALGLLLETPTEKRKPGRPKKTETEPTAGSVAKKPVGRPKKTEMIETEGTGNE